MFLIYLSFTSFLLEEEEQLKINLILLAATTLLSWMHQPPRTAESANAAPPALASTASVDIKSPIRQPMAAI